MHIATENWMSGRDDLRLVNPAHHPQHSHQYYHRHRHCHHHRHHHHHQHKHQHQQHQSDNYCHRQTRQKQHSDCFYHHRHCRHRLSCHQEENRNHLKGRHLQTHLQKQNLQQDAEQNYHRLLDRIYFNCRRRFGHLSACFKVKMTATFALKVFCITLLMMSQGAGEYHFIGFIDKILGPHHILHHQALNRPAV